MTALAGTQPIATGINSASNADSARTAGGGVAVLGQSSIIVIDLPNPAAPADPVGTYAASFATDETLTVVSSTADGVVALNVGTTVSRAYVLADNAVAGDTAAYVTETFTLGYTAPIAGSIEVMNANLNTPGLTIAANVNFVSVGGGGAAAVTFNGASSGSGTITHGLETITYSASISLAGVFVSAKETMPVGALPGAGSNSDGTATGVPWNVQYGEGMGIFAMQSDSSDMKASYNLTVSPTPPPP